MRFSPLLITNLIVQPIRYFFHNYSPKGSNLYWDEDPKKTKMDIGSINDFHKITIQEKPRVLVSRGNYTISHTGLSDNLVFGKTLKETKGLQSNTNMVLISGTASIIIEARNEGTAELLTDTISHFLVWTYPFVADTQGLKNFAIPMMVSAATPGKEDKEIFQVSLSLPYRMEEFWTVKNDALKLNQFFMKFDPLQN